MSYNGSGTFNINSTGQPVVAGTVITASAFNALTTDLATGLTTAITKDGQTTTTARITFAQGITSSLVTDSSSVSTGSIITAGGAGIAKNLYVGGIASFSAQPIFTSLTASSAVATDASKGLVSVTNTGTGNNVLATAPTIASLNLTTALTIASASGTVGQVLTSGGSGGAPTWSSPSTTSISNGTSNVTVNSSGGTITAATNGTTAITVDTSQRVGIGTTAPNKPLSVYGGDGYIQMLNASTGTATGDGAFIGVEGGTTALRIVNQENDVISFSTNGLANERMRISSGGSVGIGTTSPSTILQVNSATPVVTVSSTGTTASSQNFTTNSAAQRTTIGTEQSGGAGLFVGSTAYAAVFGSAGASNTELASNNTVRMTISTSGSIGAPTGTNIYNASDARLKKNIQPLTKGLDAVNALKPVSFNWITDFCTVENDKIMYGFVAQDTREVDENLVEGFNNGSDVVVGDLTVEKAMRVNEKFIIPMLTKAIQELKAINDTQAETINALTARIVALESK